MTFQTEQAKASLWQLDPAHTLVEFSARHLMVSTVKGRFRTVSGTIRADGDDPTRVEVSVTIDATSIDTGVPDRDTHLRSPDFLDVERFPTITFRSKRVEALGGDRYRVVGDLTIRDVTREVALDATLLGRAMGLAGKEVVGFTASTTIDRRDFGATWNVPLEAGGILVGNEVRIAIEAEAIREG
ncbi:MAG TPA: YceI family protein [Chloroflexota bacterium]